MRVWFMLPFILFALNGQSQTNAYSLGVDGVRKVESGEFASGIKLLKQARNLEPQQYDYTFEIGRAYFLSGEVKKAEKYLYPLQFHVDVQPDLYVLLAECYFEINEGIKNPDSERKKELNALRYGIQKLPKSGNLYLELGKRKLDMDEPIKALAVFEQGITNAPNFAENYFWSAKLLKATGNALWTWIYAEVFYNMTENEEMKRTAALLIKWSTEKIFDEGWKADPEKMDQDLKFMLTSKCKSQQTGWNQVLDKRSCLLKTWGRTEFPISVIINRMDVLNEKGLLEPYLASIYLESNKEAFLNWLPGKAAEFEAYRKWRYWNPIFLKQPLKRLP